MADPTKKEALDREAFAYIQLGTLVQRPRPEAKSEAVAKVLADSLSVEEKIRRIERIDAEALLEAARPAASAPSKPPPSRRSAQAVYISPLRRDKPSVDAANKSRARILADVATGSRLLYVFKEGMEIRAKAKGNRFLRPGILRLSFARDASRFFLESFRRDQGVKLGTALDAVLSDGWRFLSKSEYNRFAALNRLAIEVNGAVPNAADLDSPQSVRRFFGLEIAFLSLRADPSSTVQIAAGFDSVLSKLSYARQTIEEARSAARRLLQNGGPPPCVQDLILAVAMVRARRFLRVSDLMSFDNAALMSVSEFDCSDEVQDAIDERIGELVKWLEVLSRENEEILRLQAFVRRDGEGEIDYAPLATLYGSDKERRRSWEKDEGNAVLLLPGIADRFLALLATLRIKDQALDLELSRLQGLMSKLEKIRFSIPVLPWPRFAALRSHMDQATKFEAECMALMIEAADIFYRCGSRLVELLRSRGALPVQSAGRPASAPEERADFSLEDIALRQALSTATTAAYLAALKFREPTIGAALKNERQSGDQRRSVLEEIERLADAETFNEARKKAGMPSGLGPTTLQSRA
jgi:hypothetical protein